MHSRTGVAAVSSLRWQSMYMRAAFGNAYIARSANYAAIYGHAKGHAFASPPDGAALILIKFFPGL